MLLTLLPFIVYVAVFFAMCAAIVLLINQAATAEEQRQRELEAYRAAALPTAPACSLGEAA